MIYVVLAQATNVYIWTILEPLEAASPEEAGRKAFERDPRLRGRVVLAFPADTAATCTSEGAGPPIFQGRLNAITLQPVGYRPRPEKVEPAADVSEFDDEPPPRPALRLLPGGKLPENPRRKDSP